MSDDARCGTCAFWRYGKARYVSDGIQFGGDGSCYRFPPTAFISSHGPSSLHPSTMDTDWCGEWKGKDAEA